MNLSQSTRKGILQTARKMLAKLENLCQHEYVNIENCQKKIKHSQDLLANLENEYLKCKTLIDEIEKKMK